MAEKQFELTWVDPARMALLFIPLGVGGAVGYLVFKIIDHDFFFGLSRFPLLLVAFCVLSGVQGWIYALFLNLVMRLFQKGPIFEADEVTVGTEEARRRMMWER